MHLPASGGAAIGEAGATSSDAGGLPVGLGGVPGNTGGSTGVAGTPGNAMGGVAGEGGTPPATDEAMRPECVQSLGHVDIQFSNSIPFMNVGSVTHDFMGTVLEVQGSHVRFSTCAVVSDGGVSYPGGVDENGLPKDCVEEDWGLDVVGPGLILPLEFGMRVRVTVQMVASSGVGASVLITDPSTTPATLLLAVSGGLTPIGAPFEVQEIDLECPTTTPPSEPCGAVPTVSALDFDTPSDSVRVYQGETKQIAVTGDESRWDIRNVRSFRLGTCDELYSTQYYIVLKR